jgi:signal transduction histidine kinase
MRRSGPSIRHRIVRGIVAVALVPLAVTGAVVLVSLQRLSADTAARVEESRATLSRQVVSTGMEGTAQHVANAVDKYMLERVRDVYVWASDPVTRGAALAGTQESDRRGLKARSIPDLEAEFRDDPALGVAPRAGEYLAGQAAMSGAFAELFFTDANGFNVAYSQKTTDFVQSDEDWWQNAWSHGLDVGVITYDESAKAFSSEIAVRIDGADGTGVGVLKAVLNLDAVQQIADMHAQGRDITMLNEQGLLLAETSSAHDPQRIMNPKLVYAGSVEPQVAQTLRSIRDGGTASVVTDRVALGAAVSGRSPDQIGGFKGFPWTIVVSQPTEVAFAPLGSLSQVQRSIDTTSTLLAIVVGTVLVLVGVGAFVVAVLLGRRIVRPILALRDAADEVATTRLPALVEAIERLPAGEAPPTPEPITVDTHDELEELAERFNTVVSTAGALAAGQAEGRRRDLSTAFVSMGRRNQNLLGRQLRVLDDLERNESDPDVLAGLFKADQLAAHMRRNAESLLVLAGNEPVRTWSRPVAMHDVVRAAVSEIEDYARVDTSSIHTAYVRGNVVSQLAHLLAELCENATAYSSPDTVVEVVGRVRPAGYRLSVVDRGIGMSEDELAAANGKLRHPDGFDRVPSRCLGLFVVGRLALRLGIEVRLFESGADGIIARVMIPDSLLEAGPGPAQPNGDGAGSAADGGPAAPDGGAGRAAATEITPSGFRVRQPRGPAAAPPGGPDPALPTRVPVAGRSPEEARDTVSTFMTGVDRGRRDAGGSVVADDPSPSPSPG